MKEWLNTSYSKKWFKLSAIEEKLNSHNLVVVTNHKMKVLTRIIAFILIQPAVISNTPQVSIKEYNKLKAEIRRLKKDLQVMK